MNSNQPEALGLTPAKRPVLVLNPTEDGSFTYFNNYVTICWRESFNISFHSDSFLALNILHTTARKGKLARLSRNKSLDPIFMIPERNHLFFLPVSFNL